ncbi:hypothetical protein [Nocardioides sp. MH1]|uniref:hypothetical protein n=1 Tax=Nocardioides sp. MH1 TaxID=3242490 RepID=UPI00352075B0
MRRTAASALAAVAAVLAAAVTGVVATPAPAEATACSGTTGITVVVDFNELGGGITAGCDPDGAGESATQVFEHAGYELTYVQSDPGFVCRVSGKPADNPCVRTPPTTAYWSLWWSDGESGRWTYATSGANGLEVPEGGYLGFSWHQGDGRAQAPDAVPTPRESTPTPSQQPTHTGGGHQGGPTGGATDGAPTTAPTQASAPTSTATSSAPASPTKASTPASDKPGSEATEATETGSSTVPGAAEITADPPGTVSTESSADDGGTLPTWIGLGLAAVVLGAAGVVVALRRRERGGPPA